MKKEDQEAVTPEGEETPEETAGTEEVTAEQPAE